jgi:hypothetical protein
MKKILFLAFLTLTTNAFAQETKKVWDWDSPTGGLKEVKVEKTVFSEKSPKVCCKEKSDYLHQNPVAVQQTINELYNINPIIRRDGTFHSPKLSDLDSRVGELYKVSGAAINAYTYQSFMARNALERKLDSEWNEWQSKKAYYLHNSTPRKPSK